MSMKIILTVAFLTNTLLGVFCMMPMAHGEEMPMPDDMPHKSMNMSPVPQMSPANCEHCLKEEQPTHDSENQKSPCDDGQCFSNVPSSNLAISSTFTSSIISPPPSGIIFLNVPFEQPSRPISTAPPNSRISTRTVVLRF